jgi:hypothetical protein
MLSGKALAQQPVYGQCYFQSRLVSRSLLRASSSGMLYEDAEKLYGKLRVVTEALVEKVLHVLYPTSLPLSSAATTHASGPLTVFAHNMTPFPRQDTVCVPFTEERTSSGNVLQTTSDGMEGYTILEGVTGGGLVLPSQISPKDLGGAQALSRSPSLTHTWGSFCRCHYA